jgi:ectoine hydroxylase-related dioxygenase (phytanoyl-CoA dioxygenase family)
MATLVTPVLPTPVTDPGFRRSPYHLTPEQVRFFDENGYLMLRNWIPTKLLRRMQEAGDCWIRQGLELERSRRDMDEESEDYAFKDLKSGRVFYRVNYLHNKGYAASLELLGSPQVLSLAESLCGVNFVPTYESMVFKQEGDGAPIQWHQDAIHPRRWRIFNLDIYLDASRKDAGALVVIPGTQTEQQPFCNIEHEYGWEVPDSIVVEMEPGDVLMHDVMVAHGSPETHGKALRRTVYYEFRAAEEILADGPWDREWIDRRLRLMPVALRKYRQAYPAADQFDWKIEDQFRPPEGGSDDVELKIAHIWHMPGTYCSAGDAGAK